MRLERRASHRDGRQKAWHWRGRAGRLGFEGDSISRKIKLMRHAAPWLLKTSLGCNSMKNRHAAPAALRGAALPAWHHGKVCAGAHIPADSKTLRRRSAAPACWAPSSPANRRPSKYKTKYATRHSYIAQNDQHLQPVALAPGGIN
jgi:hypothetical protein